MIELQNVNCSESFSPGLKNVHFESTTPINNVWRHKAFYIIAILFRFMNCMTQHIHSFQFKNLTSINFRALNDKSAYYRFYVDKQYIIPSKKLTIMDKIRYWFNSNRILNRWKTFYSGTIFSRVVNPNNKCKTLFDALLLIMLCVNVIFVPINLCFSVDLLNGEIILIDVPNYVFLLSIILKFNTAYYQLGVQIGSRKKIARNYLRNGFIEDALSLVPFVFGIEQQSLWNFLVLFRVKTIVNLSFDFEENFNLRKNFGTYIDVVKLLSIFLFAAHMFACVFFMIAQYEINSGVINTWVQTQNIEDSPWLDQYITAMYWGSVTTLTIGYGDIVPTTEVEKGYVILVALMSSVVFGFTISNIGQIVNSIAEVKKTQRDRMSVITSFIQKRRLSPDLEIRVRKFFEYYFQIEENRDGECQELLKKLSIELRDEVKIGFYKKYLLSNQLITTTFSDEFITNVCLLMQEKLLIPEQKLQFKGDLMTGLSFIIEGKVELIVDYDAKITDRFSVIRTLSQSQVIADTYFYTQEQLPYTIKSTAFTRIVQLDMVMFKQLLEQFPQDKQRYLQLQNMIKMNEHPNLSCEVCTSTHRLNDCHVIFYQPPTKRIVQKLYSVKQERSTFIRPNRQFYKSFQDKLIIQEGVLTFAIDENILVQDQINEEFIVKYDFTRLRNAELNQEMRPKQISLLPFWDQEKLQKRRNAVRVSIRQVMDDIDNSDKSSSQYMKVFRSGNMKQSETFDEFTDIQQELYQDYLKIIKADLTPYLDQSMDYDNFYPTDNPSQVLKTIRFRSKFIKKSDQLKKSRRQMKKFTWVTSASNARI